MLYYRIHDQINDRVYVTIGTQVDISSALSIPQIAIFSLTECCQSWEFGLHKQTCILRVVEKVNLVFWEEGDRVSIYLQVS